MGHSESILISIKKLLGITEDYTHFDADIIMHINSVLAILCQLGVGPPEGFSIEDSKAQWSDFLQNDDRLNLVKSYVHHRVRLLFDPPLGSAVLEAIERTIKELDWRILVASDTSCSTSDKEAEQ